MKTAIRWSEKHAQMNKTETHSARMSRADGEKEKQSNC